MSLDITLLENKPCEVWSANITHNVVPIAKALGVYGLLWGDTHTVASDMIPSLELCLQQLDKREKDLELLNPSNGWGDVKSFRKFVHTLLDACRIHPGATVSRDV